MTPPFVIEVLGGQDRSDFGCGEPALDRYFQRQASQDVRRRVASCYVAVEQATNRVGGFYTLSACHFPLLTLPEAMQKKLPRYKMVPAVRLGRLAVGQDFQGLGLGSAILTDAIARVWRADIAAFALVVDAKHDKAAAFYRHNGFLPFEESADTLYAPMASLAKSLGLRAK